MPKVLLDYSQAFDSINHDLLAAKRVILYLAKDQLNESGHTWQKECRLQSWEMRHLFQSYGIGVYHREVAGAWPIQYVYI